MKKTITVLLICVALLGASCQTISRDTLIDYGYIIVREIVQMYLNDMDRVDYELAQEADEILDRPKSFDNLHDSLVIAEKLLIDYIENVETYDVDKMNKILRDLDSILNLISDS